MNGYRSLRTLFAAGSIVLLLLWLTNISLGSIRIPVPEILGRLMGFSFSKESWETIIVHYRLPKSLTAILAGIGLSLSGLQMQTFFRNPLAGPYVLGISSGAGLGVALWMMAGAWIPALGALVGNGPWSLFFSAALGSFVVLLVISLAAWKVKDSMTLLIIGLMFGSFASSIVTLIAYFSEAESLKLYTVWTMGSLGTTGWTQLLVFMAGTFLGLIPLVLSVKSYNAMLLGENYAQSMGISVDRLRWKMIISTGLLTGATTAFCGPIGFIGIAVPHVARLIFRTSDHLTLIAGSAMLGAITLLLCDTISQLPGSAQTLPINVITSFLGAPVVIWLVFKRNVSREF
ncbi:Vitamin B12 ABC transporter, permease component BtuC [Lunatimonas lonarensis]|uniref:Vitamin B12 ABC transporter, permease component BtuC n=1 Tax=Lunatimonas lonarensis TaxID=1232681 RepID=R7ZZC5_9BACT|nr:iron ABC transporter permease [Lunatimonas lonarensis]EON79404.1 Vitamin B12 ABC transporter, permease component BtuC [Lunatimonas lonarensis]